ncbi:MAG: hypothetical protein PHE20_02895 [Patescibacteria group bacterium]|nr:hypothetical protein [Patescibacteria group bacterium]
MTLRNYLWVMGVMTLLCWGIFALMLNLIDPTSTNWLGFMLFYVSLFLALSGSAALIGFIIRFGALKRDLVFYAVSTAFRQSFLFALFIVISLFLLSNNLFTWLNVALLLIIFAILELFVASYKKNRIK